MKLQPLHSAQQGFSNYGSLALIWVPWAMMIFTWHLPQNAEPMGGCT